MKSEGSKKIIGLQIQDFLLKPLEEEAEYYGISLSAMIRLILAQRYRESAKLNDKESV